MCSPELSRRRLVPTCPSALSPQLGRGLRQQTRLYSQSESRRERPTETIAGRDSRINAVRSFSRMIFDTTMITIATLHGQALAGPLNVRAGAVVLPLAATAIVSVASTVGRRKTLMTTSACRSRIVVYQVACPRSAPHKKPARCVNADRAGRTRTCNPRFWRRLRFVKHEHLAGSHE